MEKILNILMFLLLALILLMIAAVVVDVARSHNDANVVCSNLAVEEKSFKVYRRAVFYNGITGDYILVVEGYLAVSVEERKQLTVTVKTDDGKYLKHYLGLSDNVTYFSEQLEPEAVSDKRYKIIFKPSVIVPNIEIR